MSIEQRRNDMVQVLFSDQTLSFPVVDDYLTSSASGTPFTVLSWLIKVQGIVVLSVKGMTRWLEA